MKHILFVRLGAIGDVVQAAAALHLYRDLYPNTRITWVVDQGLVSLVSGFKVADCVIGVDASALFSGGLFSRVGLLFKTMKQLALSGHYQTVCCAHPDWRYALLTLGVRTTERISPRSLKRVGGFITHRNRSFEYFRLLTNKDAGILPLDTALNAIGAAILTGQNVNQFETPKRYIALVPGGARNALRDDLVRRWPIENYVELARQLRLLGHSIILLGGSTDCWVSDHFSRLDVHDLIGKTDLQNTIKLLDMASCVVVHDSGPLHLASITSAPMVAIFGPTPASAVLSFSRANTKALQLGNQVACSPCYDGRGYADCKRALCMEAIAVEHVVAAVKSVMKVDR